MVKENQKTLNALLVAMDIGCILVSMLLACCTRSPFLQNASGFHSEWEQLYFFAALPICPLAYYFAGLYGSRRHKRFIKELMAILYCACVMFVLLLVLLYVMEQPEYFGLRLVIFTLYFILFDGAVRYLLRRLLRLIRKKGYNLKYLLLIGGGGLAAQFVQKVTENPRYGYRFYGCLADHTDMKQLPNIALIGPVSALGDCISKQGVDEVVIALELEEYWKIPQIITLCEKNGIKVNIVPAYFQYIPSNPRMDEFDGIPVMVLRKIPLTNPFNATLKRLFDITGSLLCILFFSPVMLISWAVIRFTTGEAAIYKQERVGYGFKRFTMYKFRTMKSGKKGTRRWTQKKDKRRTKFGTLLRKLSIDELPQFFNVLSGSMSIVGPRPEIAEFVEQFKEKIPRYMVRHQVKPGITGWAQIHNLRGDTSIEERVNSDIYYIENWSLALDIQIVIRTCMYAFYNPNE